MARAIIQSSVSWNGKKLTRIITNRAGKSRELFTVKTKKIGKKNKINEKNSFNTAFVFCGQYLWTG
ncbi:protein of unknown function [Tenacibaculum sp. 190130A14a]|uniref:Uncharacterized protein n=1 Tax=Tenacibaculum polynesiense TaxID=3137857 RepID=A0ABM9P701_9FLAO